MVALTLALGVVGLPATAHAAGCEVVHDPRDRVECEARAEARAAAQAEVDRQLGGGASASTNPAPSRTAAWQDAVEEAEGFDASAVLEPRPIAAIVGLAWFFLAVRARRRARARASRA